MNEPTEQRLVERLSEGREATVQDLFAEGARVTCLCGTETDTYEDFKNHEKSMLAYYKSCFPASKVSTSADDIDRSDDFVSGWIMADKILAILQNQWFKNPAKVREIYARNPESRNELIARFLFMGCLTGRRLRAAFGDLCDSIIWEESSLEIGGVSESRFAPDPKHIKAAIEKHKPDVVLCLGKIAGDAVRSVCCEVDVRHPAVMFGPHPAARNDPMPALRTIAETLNTKSIG